MQAYIDEAIYLSKFWSAFYKSAIFLPVTFVHQIATTQQSRSKQQQNCLITSPQNLWITLWLIV